MAKKKSFKPHTSLNLAQIENEVQEIEEQTRNAIQSALDNPQKENFEFALTQVTNDKSLSSDNRDLIMNSLKDRYVALFNFNNCPEDYESLKEEAKFLSGMTQYSFLLMAQRLKKIKDNRLYEKDGYTDFKSFVEHELPVSRMTAYRYVDVVEYYGVTALLQEEHINASKLMIFLPLLKSDQIDEKEKENLKRKVIKDSLIKSFRELQSEESNMEVKFGIKGKKGKTKPSVFTSFENSLKKLKTDNISKEDKDSIERIIRRLKLFL